MDPGVVVLEAQQADPRRRPPQRLGFHGPCESGRPVTAEAQRVPSVWNFVHFFLAGPKDLGPSWKGERTCMTQG